MESRQGNARFIVFEGIDGSGKSTQARLLAESLEAAGHTVHLTFEPTNYRIGSILRRVLTGQETADEHTIAALFLADRLDHIHHPDYGIKSLLAKGQIVICDRYYYSSYAYHSQHVDMDWVIQANLLAAQALRPDIVFYMDLQPEAAMERIRGGREQVEHYEKLETLEAVRGNYLEAIRREGEKDHVRILDATQAVEGLQKTVTEAVNLLLERR